MTLGYKVRIYDQSQDRGIRPLDVRYDYGFIVTSLISVNVKTLGYGADCVITKVASREVCRRLKQREQPNTNS